MTVKNIGTLKRIEAILLMLITWQCRGRFDTEVQQEPLEPESLLVDLLDFALDDEYRSEAAMRVVQMLADGEGPSLHLIKWMEELWNRTGRVEEIWDAVSVKPSPMDYELLGRRCAQSRSRRVYFQRLKDTSQPEDPGSGLK